MNIAELKKLINDLPDNFEFEVEVSKKLTKEELEGSKYPYPYISERCKTSAFDYDIGHSDKKIKIGVRINEL